MPKENNVGKWSKLFAGLTFAARVLRFNEHQISKSFAVGQKVWCLHCGKFFLAENVAVDEAMSAKNGEVFFECPNDCDGSPLDFAELPWWDNKLTEPGDGACDYKWREGMEPK